MYEKMKNFKYLGSLVSNQNSLQEEIKCRLKAGNSCYYLVQGLLSSRLYSKNLIIKIYKIILPVVLYGCEAWFIKWREESRLRVFENRILRRKCGPNRDANGEWRRFQNDELHTLYRSSNMIRLIKWILVFFFRMFY